MEPVLEPLLLLFLCFFLVVVPLWPEPLLWSVLPELPDWPIVLPLLPDCPIDPEEPELEPVPPSPALELADEQAIAPPRATVVRREVERTERRAFLMSDALRNSWAALAPRANCTISRRAERRTWHLPRAARWHCHVAPRDVRRRR